MNLFRRALSPGQRETPMAPFPWSNSLKKVKYFLATFHYGWHTHGKFEIMLILLLWKSFQSNSLDFLKWYKLWGCFSCFFMGAREPWQRKGQLDSEQLTQVSRHIWGEISDEPTVFLLLMRIQHLFFFLRKEDLCHLWCFLLKPLCGWQHLGKWYLLKIIPPARSKRLAVNSLRDF